jgi:hypothetical protein
MLAWGALPVGWIVIVVVTLYRSGSFASRLFATAGAGAALAFALVAALEFEFEVAVVLVPAFVHPYETSVVSAIPATKAVILCFLLISAYDIVSSLNRTS